MKILLSDAAYLDELIAYLFNVGFIVEQIGPNLVEVSRLSSIRHDQARMEIDLFLEAWKTSAPRGRCQAPGLIREIAHRLLGLAGRTQPNGPRLNADGRQHLVPPGVAGETGANGGLTLHVDHEQSVLAVALAHRPTENDRCPPRRARP